MKRLATILLLAFASALALRAQPPAAAFTRTEDVIYGRKFGTALTLDVFRPEKPNGCAIAYMVSGGWFSAHESIGPNIPIFVQPLINRGYTVFAVVHGSQPKFTITEILPDIHRALRFIRHHAADYGVQPDKLVITGGSAGGHLSLMMAVQGRPGPADARDPIDRESSAVQCVACFFPPTDFLNYSGPDEDATGIGTLKNFKPAFGPRADDPAQRRALAREISPIYHVRSNQPPVLIIHGDADRLVPIYQAEQFVQRSTAVGATAEWIVRKSKLHGWAGAEKDVELFADWFDRHLRGLESAAKRSDVDKPGP